METKTCPACFEEINPRATRCPRCGTFQRSWVRVIRHPIFLIVFFLGLMSLSYIPMYGMMPEYTQATDKVVSVLESRYEISPSNCNSGNRVDVIGKVKNLTDHTIRRLIFNLEFFDANGKTVDFLSDEANQLIVPAGATSTFKVGGNITADPASIRKHTAKVAQVQVGGEF